MKRRSVFSMFRDPTKRPRAIMWTGVIVFVLAALAVTGGVIYTSTYTFCATTCHKVQDDTIAAYNASSHSQISCMACHEPANANTLQLVVAKIRSAGEIYPTVTNTFKLPLNEGSAYGLSPKEMGDGQCTQCHSTNRQVTSTSGVLIDHAVHTKAGITCTTCHNRVAHPEDKITLKLPGNRKHADFMKMDACFRCHDLSGAKKAPGTCPTCHTPAFQLLPKTHADAAWATTGHTEAANESQKEFKTSQDEATKLVEEGVAADLVTPVEHCSTCHTAAFCTDCHSRRAPK